MASEGQPSAGYAALVRRNPNFRSLWLGQIVSLLGDWFNLIASAALIANLSGSGFAVGGLFVVRMLAPFLISPIAGVVADHYNRKRTLILTDLLRAGVVMCFLLVREPGDIWLLYALTALQLGLSGFFFPARNAILPDVVSPEELGAANALSSTTWSVMLALGAALGGLVSGTWGIYPAFVIDAGTFLVSAAFVARVVCREEPRPTSDRGIRGAMQQYLDGLRYLADTPEVLAVTLHKAASALFISSGFQVVQVAIAGEIFPIGEAGGISLGLMFGMAGVGTGIGPILARHFTGDRQQPLRVAILAGYLVSAAGLAVTAPLLSFETVLLGTLLRGAGGGTIWVFSTQLLLQQVQGHMRGRIFSTEFAIFTLMSAIGSVAAGAALDTFLGVGGAIWWMGGLTMIPGLAWWFWITRHRREGRGRR